MSITFPGFGSDARAMLDAVHRSQAIVQFDLEGKILEANANFCAAFGYELCEIVGRHHRIFVDPNEAASAAYREFWARLARGELDRRQHRWFGKGGRGMWIEASYNPVFRGGRPLRIVALATDITEAKRRADEDAAKLAAVSRSQAVVEFTPDGEILTANEIFCDALGYSPDEIVGRHHRMFCEPAYAASDEYGRFWLRLGKGEAIADEFPCIGKSGREVWFQAAYNPILDPGGQVFKVVKLATDVTPRVAAVLKLGHGLRRLAAGDLPQQIAAPFVPTMETVRRDFNEAKTKLRASMERLAENAEEIASSSDGLWLAADDISRHIEQQAAFAGQTAAALHEITNTAAGARLRAEEAGALASRTRDNAELSGEVVRNAIAAMGQVETSSREISNVVGLIDEIAFQTNLLALNAGIEAARTGEAGGGFAVVAQEMRALAQRSANAAKDIKALISASGKHVRSGVSLVGQTGEALERIVAQVQEVNEVVAEIGSGARDQVTSLGEINKAVGAMGRGTRQNAAMAARSTAACRKLAKQTEALSGLLGQFRTGVEASMARPAEAVRAAWPMPSPGRRVAGQVARIAAVNAAVEQDNRKTF